MCPYLYVVAGQRDCKEVKDMLGPSEQALWIFMNFSINDEGAGIWSLFDESVSALYLSLQPYAYHMFFFFFKDYLIEHRTCWLG